MSDEFTLSLMLTDKQAYLLIKYLRHITRILLGDYNEIKEISFRKEIGFVDHDKFELINRELMDLFHPDLVSSNGYYSNWGIGNNKIKDVNILFDIVKILEYEISWRDNLLGDITTNFDKPLGWSNEPLKVTHLDPNYEIYISFFKRFNHSINQMINKMGWSHDSEKVSQWIEACKEFALHEHIHITTTNTPLPHQEYLDFFNERVTSDGKYIEWNGEGGDL